MSAPANGVTIVWDMLKSNTNLTAIVPAASIRSGDTPIDAALPAISITEVQANEHLNIPMDSANFLATSHVRVRVQVKTYAAQKSILDLARKALPNTHGTVHGFTVDSILPDLTGPDEYDADAVIYSQTKDFIIKFAVAN